MFTTLKTLENIFKELSILQTFLHAETNSWFFVIFSTEKSIPKILIK